MYMRKLLWSFLEVLKTVAIAVVAVMVVRTFVAQPFLVSGASMEPSFSNGDYLLIDELTYRFREPERGEVIVFRYPKDERSFYIKRIIGLPGERVVVSGGKVSVFRSGGELTLEEPYAQGVGGGARAEFTAGPGEYFVMGDNRGASFDSRSWGTLAASEIMGVVRLRLWPVGKAMAFNPPTY